MRRAWRPSKGAALVEYALVMPLVLLMFLGTLEIFRLILFKQSLRSALREVLPCYTHVLDTAYASDPMNVPQCQGVSFLGEEYIRYRLGRSLFALQSGYGLAVSTEPELSSITSNPYDSYGLPLRVTAVLRVPFAFFRFGSWPADIEMVESAQTFVDVGPVYLGLEERVPFPHDPGGY